MKPIIFNTEMVKAILDGRKTRFAKFIGNRFRITEFLPFNEEEKHMGYRFSILDEKTNSKYDTASLDFFTAYGFSKYKLDDILYVKETFQTCECSFCEICQVLDGIVFKADYNNKGEHPDLYSCHEDETYWKPSIHMPKKYARIFLKVTNVRVERLQDIYDKDCIKEGVRELGNCIPPNYDINAKQYYINNSFYKTKKDAFKGLWNSIAKDGYRWEDNPYVFVYEFERVKK